MTISQVVEALCREKQEGLTSRFPCRAIMVKTIEQYNALLLELQKIPDIVLVSANELFSSADVMPRYINLKDPSYTDKWIILPGVSEYLRLFSKSEAENRRFMSLWSYQAPATNRGRIIIPLWGCEAQWHDQALHLCEDLRQNDFYISCVSETDDEQQMEMLVLSGKFEQYISQLASHGQMLSGLRKWYEYWTVPSAEPKKLLLLTKRCALIQPTAGNISIRVVDDVFAFIRENLPDGYQLNREDCPSEAQHLLFSYALAGVSLDEALLSALNIASFVDTDMMSRWEALSEGQKQLVVLWVKRHPQDRYLNHCIQNAASIEAIPEHILYDIFTLRSFHPAWEAESQNLMTAMRLRKDERFFTELDRMPVYEDRLPYLSGSGKEERIYLLRMVGKWMREDAGQVLRCKRLEQIYPELYVYLSTAQYDPDLGGYFMRYKSHKLENTLPMDESLHFAGLQADAYDYRYDALSRSVTEDCAILWIDALGAEWLPLLVWALEQNKNGKMGNVFVTQATLPTETCFNEQWNRMDVPYVKMDRLDKLAHKGVIDDPDYYACIEEQLSFVHRISERVDALLKTYQRVIITGDHGTSRLAARCFHKRDGLIPPPGSTVCSHGRYCKLDVSAEAHPQQVAVKGNDGCQYLVFANYDHFKQSGFAAGADDDKATYGEVHGGASPEEMLVPVVVFDSTKEKPLTAQWQKAVVKISMKKAKAVLQFSRPVHTLQMKLGAAEGTCTAASDKKQWTVEWRGIAPGTYRAAIDADGHLIDVQPLVIQSALGGGDGDLP